MERALPMKNHLLEAAELGNPEAQFNLAMICENGVTDSRYTSEGKHCEAMRWLLAAAEHGLPRAQTKLAELYAVVSETPESWMKACGWNLVATASLEGIHLKQAQTAYRSPLRPLDAGAKRPSQTIRRELERAGPGEYRGFEAPEMSPGASP